jgi:hypothetical protein
MLPRWQEWHLRVFQEWGPLRLQDAIDLREMEADRMMAIQVGTVQKLIPLIVADG